MKTLLRLCLTTYMGYRAVVLTNTYIYMFKKIRRIRHLKSRNGGPTCVCVYIRYRCTSIKLLRLRG